MVLLVFGSGSLAPAIDPITPQDSIKGRGKTILLAFLMGPLSGPNFIMPVFAATAYVPWQGGQSTSIAHPAMAKISLLLALFRAVLPALVGVL